MTRVFNFSPGPATLPEPVLRKAAEEMLDWHGSGMSVMEMSHRGKEFIGIHAEAESLVRELMGVPANYKVYQTKDVNAWAMANGCIRVYSGLMDMMTDNEVEGVLGHEMGHVALGHTRKAMQVALTTTATRTAAASVGVKMPP